MVKNRLCHWGPIAALTIITFLFCASTLTFIIWCPPTDTVAIVHSFIFMFWVISIFRNFFKAIYLGPGHVPFRWKPEEEEDTEYLQYCQPCQGYKAPRSHHCKICKRCVMKMDHHCPWINNCVGHHNHKSFTLFLFFVVVGCTHAAVLMFLCVVHHMVWVNGAMLIRVDPRSYIRINHIILIVLFFGIGLSIGVTIAVGILLYYQFKSILQNETGIESWIIDKAKSRPRDPDDEFVFPYDLGLVDNVKQVLTWSNDYVGDGIIWQVFPGCTQYDLTIEQLEQKELKRENMVTYKVVQSFSGSYVPTKYGIRTCCNSPCCDENRLAVNVGERINATRFRKFWVFGEKIEEKGKDSNGEPLPLGEYREYKGWIPKQCLQEFIDDGITILEKKKVQ